VINCNLWDKGINYMNLILITLKLRRSKHSVSFNKETEKFLKEYNGVQVGEGAYLIKTSLSPEKVVLNFRMNTKEGDPVCAFSVTKDFCSIEGSDELHAKICELIG
jgi:hypothetical protein